MPRNLAVAVASAFERLQLWLLAGILIMGCGVLRAQTATATISGVATDPSGAVVSGATVTATNVLTGFKQEAVSFDDGHYILPLLPAGRYTIAVRREGFRPATVEELILQIGELLNRLPWRERGSYPVVPLIFIAAAVWLVLNALETSPVESIAGAGLILSGLPLYL